MPPAGIYCEDAGPAGIARATYAGLTRSPGFQSLIGILS